MASHNAGVTVAIVAIANPPPKVRRLFSMTDVGETVIKEVPYINAYLVSGLDVIVEKSSRPLGDRTEMLRGNMPYDGGHLLLTRDEVNALGLTPEQQDRFIRRIYGSEEFIHNKFRFCLWIEDQNLAEAQGITAIARRIEGVRKMRLASSDKSAREMAVRSHQMREMNIGVAQTLVIPIHSSESRNYLPVGCIPGGDTTFNAAFAMYDAPLWNMALIASRLHVIWIGTVCGKLETRYRYSNTLGRVENQRELITPAAR